MKTTMVSRIVGVTLGLVCVAGVALGDPVEGGTDAVGTTPSASDIVASWESENVCVYKKGEWVLRIEYLQKGSRSEGQNGILLKGGQAAVEEAEKGTVLETPLGKLKHYGAERKVRWGITGWNFADRSQVKRSSQVPAAPVPDVPATPPKGTPCCGCSGK